ncbi:ATP-binding protein [Pseudonocardia oroxyli]|uniref:Novel STAND NTPase 1 domain-containing protein n=1 Tax=Pseudonocardia oroxyli TaxID=366584 RepID=A0A1G7Q9S2_PSEOR|nr:ATP-binding protein [Pseudonocardia oroxyli]SDF95228.1 hypothetical protein SAMN05216377_10811 [Pseudonocardia oroxyli]
MHDGEAPADPDRAVDRAGFAAELGRMKSAAGLSFRALARRTVASSDAGVETGVPQLPFTTIRDYVQGRTLPSAARLEIVLTALGLAPADPDRVRWQAALTRAGTAATRPSPDLRPYPGAAPVERDLRGRDAETAEVLRLLQATPPGGTVVVTGPSGVGVTSLLRAGVLPELDAVAELGPGPDPAGRLARALAGPAAHLLVDDVHTLLDAELRATLRGLLDGGPRGGPRVLLGIREDALADLGADVSAPGVVRLRGPSAENLRAIMTGPAAAAGFPPADGLADLLLAELEIAPEAASSPPGALPLLAEALAATWDRAVADGSPTVTIAHLRASGGLRGAAERMAERAYAAVGEGAALVRPLLLRTVRAPGSHGAADAGRRRVRRLALTYGQPPGDALASVAAVLVAGRVLTTDAEALEIAHDVVLRSWGRLAGWIADDRARHPARSMISEATWVWYHTGRDPGSLLRGRRLAEATAFVADPGRAAELYPMERELVDGSRAQGDRRETGQLRALRIAVGVLAAALVLTLVVLVGVLVGPG